MRAFLMIGVLIEQMMFANFHDLYPDFIGAFKYPKLKAHGCWGMASPKWFAYSEHGWDKKVDWDVVLKITEVLLGNLYDWLRGNSCLDEMAMFPRMLKIEVSQEFEKNQQ